MSRFESHLKKNLLNVHKNIYLSKDDENYYEKILRYHDPSSPEAHYHLGQKWEQKGAFVKAYKHYQQAMNVHSPYYFKAKKANKHLEEQINLNQTTKNGQAPAKKALPLYVKVMVFTLLFINACLLILLFLYPPFSSMISSTVKKWNTGTEVVYETEDLPYVIYFPTDTPQDEIEKSLHDKAIQLGNNVKNKNVLLYGVVTTDPKLSFQILPLKNESIQESSFVRAEFNSTLNEPVKIRFLNNDDQEASRKDPYTIQYIGANLVRTALQAYMKDKGAPPDSIEQLASDYPDNYLSFIPNEAITGSNSVADAFSGQGGWVYNPHASRVADMFYPNTHTDTLPRSPVPFSPIQVDIDKAAFSLIIKSSPYIISTKKIGIGKDDSTPEGQFPIFNRVLEPLGEHPNTFGTAALGMGDIAIHGTTDERSIQNTKSHGCIRLVNPDIEEIFDFVPKGAMVKIHDGNQDERLAPIAQSLLEQLLPDSELKTKQTTATIFSWAG
ncbi:hypothetical protein FGG79_17375 [Bacillus sp. BHET2]|uniref:L,D-transpeptidase n=1 Tax=Bacillus sp. BHET2 TaxID=2583818 RepID=UPI00110E2143|nr:L,D-transpeptidase [Bacillus sp. BHET2]TMU83923.1 hypothetical protein FGG79_17375 [Bacillus sp. BHET2]